MDKSRKEIAMENFEKGYNCAQSVTLAFSDLMDIDEKVLLQMSSSFGAGFGRLREVCGAVSGMALVSGYLFGYSDPKDAEGKIEHYTRIQELAHAFEEENGSLICRELLGVKEKHECPIPEARTKEYYEKRPCKQLIGCAAKLLEEYLVSVGYI